VRWPILRKLTRLLPLLLLATSQLISIARGEFDAIALVLLAIVVGLAFTSLLLVRGVYGG
jgi:hypothetical protein